MRTFSSFVACRKALAIYKMEIARRSHASTTPVKKILLVATVGEEPSDLSYLAYVRCLLESYTFLALMSPFLFSVMNISNSSVSFLSWDVSSDESKGS